MAVTLPVAMSQMRAVRSSDVVITCRPSGRYVIESTGPLRPFRTVANSLLATARHSRMVPCIEAVTTRVPIEY